MVALVTSFITYTGATIISRQASDSLSGLQARTKTTSIRATRNVEARLTHAVTHTNIVLHSTTSTSKHTSTQSIVWGR